MTLFDASGVILALIAIAGAIAFAVVAGTISARLFLDATRQSEEKR